MVHLLAGVLGAGILYWAVFGTDIGPAEVAVGLFLGAYVFGMAYLHKS